MRRSSAIRRPVTWPARAAWACDTSGWCRPRRGPRRADRGLAWPGRARFPGVDVQFIVKTTASSLESFFEVNRRLGRGRALISTVDAWCRPADFTRFVDAARRRPADASVLAVTPFVADEKPVWVSV